MFARKSFLILAATLCIIVGPAPTGLGYCINSAALNFVPDPNAK